MDQQRLEVDIYQIADDSMMKRNRTDGSGWDWCWADSQRDWMAPLAGGQHRWLPMTIANQTGWWIRNPVGFTATWSGTPGSAAIQFDFEVSGDVWSGWINSQFGEGIITWNTPFLFRTRPRGSRLLICGPANYFKANAHPLTALVESDWISMSFTMNYKIMIPDRPVHFAQGEPLFQAIPLKSNICAELETAVVTYERPGDNPELAHGYQESSAGRCPFAERSVGAQDSLENLHIADSLGRAAGTLEVKPPEVRYDPRLIPPR